MGHRSFVVGQHFYLNTRINQEDKDVITMPLLNVQSTLFKMATFGTDNNVSILERYRVFDKILSR